MGGMGGRPGRHLSSIAARARPALPPPSYFWYHNYIPMFVFYLSDEEFVKFINDIFLNSEVTLNSSLKSCFVKVMAVNVMGWAP